MIIRSVEPPASEYLYWLIQAGLLLVLIGALLIAMTALGNPRVIHSLLNAAKQTSAELEGR